MVLEIEPGHAENIPSLVEIQVPKSLHGSVDTSNLFELFKSKSSVLLTSMESRFWSLHIWKRHQILDCNIPRQKPLREWVTRQRPMSFSRKLWRSGLREYWGNSCKTADYSLEISVRSVRRLYSDYRGELDWYYCQWILQEVHSGNQHLEIDNENDTPHGPPRTRIWRSSLLEIDGFEATMYVPERWRRYLLWFRLDHPYLEGKQ